MKKRIFSLALALSLALTLALAPAPALVTEAAASSFKTLGFPYVLGEHSYITDSGCFKSWGGWTYGQWAFSSADIMVIEYEGTFTNSVSLNVYWKDGKSLNNNKGSERITEAPGKLTLDLRGLEGHVDSIGIGFWPEDAAGRADMAKIKRVYLDVLPLEVNPTPRHFTVTDSKGLTDAANAAKPGDVILAANGTYYGSFTIPPGVTLKSAPGAKPAITPAVPFKANWSVHSGNIYVADIGDAESVMEKEFPQLFVDGVSMVEARYPNLPGSDMSSVMEQEMLITQNGTNNSAIVLPEALPFDARGAMVVIWPGEEGWGAWHASFSRVASVSGRTLTLAQPIKSPPPVDGPEDSLPNFNNPVPGNAFYLTGALSLLDAPGEYYYDERAKKLYFYAPDGGNPNRLNLSLKTTERYALNVSSFTTIDGFIIYGGGIYAAGRNNIIQNCVIRYADHFYVNGEHDFHNNRQANGFTVFGVDNIVRRCEIGPTSAAGLVTSGAGNVITDNIIHNSSYAGTKFAALHAYISQGLEVSNNTIYNSGHWQIQFDGLHVGTSIPFSGSVVKNNHLKNAMVLCSDGGAFYTYDTDGAGSEVFNNFVESNNNPYQGAKKKLAQGLYPDNFARNYIIRNNIILGGSDGFVANLPSEGIQIFNNTVIGSDVGFSMGSQYNISSAKGFMLKDNLFVDIKSIDYTYQGMDNGKYVWDTGNFDENGSFPIFHAARDGIVISGNARGTVDSQYRPTGDTPNIGAIPRGGSMFEYGATWKLGEVPAPPPEAPNVSAASSWARDYINTAFGNGIIPTSLQNNYRNNITRAEFCALAVELIETVTGRPITERQVFADDRGDINIRKIGGLGIVTGTGNNAAGERLFAPNDPIQRQQAALILTRVADHLKKPLPNQAPAFSDNNRMENWARAPIGQMQATGIMTGSGGNFDPRGTYTREQSIITMVRMWNWVKG